MSDNRFKSMKNDGLGASKVEKVGLGDIVRWKIYDFQDTSDDFVWQYGLVLDIIKDIRLSGWLYTAKITTFGDGKEVYMPLISVEKVENYENMPKNSQK